MFSTWTWLIRHGTCSTWRAPMLAQPRVHLCELAFLDGIRPQIPRGPSDTEVSVRLKEVAGRLRTAALCL
eukprot:CAMPEP_0115838838 /NCGR_PEP_ID=MMETSP0287-20121206/5940_1 /TAXON_ID=412157 /ORGANISM="Chrysochromulina rotalis, Strain UIO044" /LENGTH=69 /DNA_ID=CAMNT_0003292387 /DNA_START=699 /DNA_END=908 /DNA_ORIENTATION=+